MIDSQRGGVVELHRPAKRLSPVPYLVSDDDIQDQGEPWGESLVPSPMHTPELLPNDAKQLWKETSWVFYPDWVQPNIGRVHKHEANCWKDAFRVTAEARRLVFEIRVQTVSLRPFVLRERLSSDLPAFSIVATRPAQMVFAYPGLNPATLAASTESFVSRAARFEVKGRHAAALDFLYDSVDSMLRNGEFSKLNALLRDVLAENYSDDILVGLLTATYPAKSVLSERTELFLRIEAHLMARGEDVKALLAGLEP